MTAFQWLSAGALVASIVAGTISVPARPHPPVFLGGYRVLAADFHVHNHPLSSATLSPWDTVIEADRQGLDVIAMTGHNNVWSSQLGRWYSQRFGGPMVLIGEELSSVPYDLICVGISRYVSWHQPLMDAIADVHRQGGVAIAAHPFRVYSGSYNDAAARVLDGSEIVRPEVEWNDEAYAQLKEFYARGHMTAIGSSDHHGLGRLGAARTYVFVREASERGVLDALREGHTVVYDYAGGAYGDEELIKLAARDGRMPAKQAGAPEPGWLAVFSRVSGVLGLVSLLLLGTTRSAGP